jgi:hypothetical protein
LLCLVGVWDLGANLPSPRFEVKTLPPGCAWSLNRRTNNGTATSFTVDNLNRLEAIQVVFAFRSRPGRGENFLLEAMGQVGQGMVFDLAGF